MSSGPLAEEISRRRNFAIISTPTRADHLDRNALLFGGAIQMRNRQGPQGDSPRDVDWMRLSSSAASP